MPKDEHVPRGRPPLRRGEPSVNFNVKLPSSEYDRIYRCATARRESLSEWARQTIARRARDEDDEDG